MRGSGVRVPLLASFQTRFVSRVLNVPVVPMCLLVIIEAVIAVMLHHAELWVHGLLILAELCAGVAGKKTVLIILCAVVYIAATFALQMLDKGETHNGQ